MEDQIVNRVAKSSIITYDISTLYQNGPRFSIDISIWLNQGLILVEKEFRQSLQNTDWAIYKDAYVNLYCSTDAIIPSWAYMLISTYLNPIVKKVIVGTPEELENLLFLETIQQLDITAFNNKPVIIKGCSDIYIPDSTYLMLIKRLQPIVKSLMYGEACSAVPLFKPKKTLVK